MSLGSCLRRVDFRQPLYLAQFVGAEAQRDDQWPSAVHLKTDTRCNEQGVTIHLQAHRVPGIHFILKLLQEHHASRGRNVVDNESIEIHAAHERSSIKLQRVGSRLFHLVYQG